MDKGSILLVSFDEEYVTSVEGYLSKNLLESFSLEFITQIEYLTEYLKAPHKIAVLIVEEKLLSFFNNNQAVARTLIITDTDKIGADLVSKYTGAQGIVKILGPQYMSVDAGGERPRTNIIDVVSTNQPAFNTLAALAISSQLAGLGKKVLYLCAENIQCFNSSLFKEGDALFSQEAQALAITSIINGDMSRMDGLIQEGVFDFIPQFDRFLSSYGLSSEHFYLLAEIIAKLEIYDEIVIEHPFGFSAGSIARLEKSRNIVISSGQDKLSHDKLEVLFDNTRGVHEHCVIACYPYDTTATDYLSELDKDNSMICERIEAVDEMYTLRQLVEKRVFRNIVEAIL